MKFGVAFAVFCLAASLYGADALKCWTCETLRTPLCADPVQLNETLIEHDKYQTKCVGFLSEPVCYKKIVKTGNHAFVTRGCEEAITYKSKCIDVSAEVKTDCEVCSTDLCNAAPLSIIPVGALIISMLMLTKIFQF